MLMEILNYNYKKRTFERLPDYSKKLSDLVVKAKEITWEYEESGVDGLLDIRLMKYIDGLYGYKIKNQNKKNIKGTEIAEIVKLVFYQIPKPNENIFKNNITYSDDSKKLLKIDYLCLISICNIIWYILKDIVERKNFPQLLNEILEQNNYSKIMDVKIWDSSLMKYKDDFNKVESISFNLTGSHDSNIELYYTILFYYFYKVLFPNVHQISINLNETKINNIYNSDKNPYKIKENDVIIFCDKFKNLFLSNFIITGLIGSNVSLQALRIVMYESYIHEIIHIFSNEFEKSRFKEKISIKHSLIYFRKLMLINQISRLSITINCLDRILFKEIINLIVLNRNTEILELQLFSDQKSFNLRKLYLNYLRGLEFDEIDPEINEKYQIIMYPYVDSLDNISPLIEEEKIPDLLFPFFKKNINNLRLALNDYIKAYKTFYLDISPYEELCKYDNYNIEILLFIYIVLSALETSSMITRLQLKCLNINYISVQQIKKTINKLKKEKLKDENKDEELKDIDLSKCEALESIAFNMTGISFFIDFSKLPIKSLKIIDIEISSLKDLKSINEGLKNQKDKFTKLTEIRLIICINNFEDIFDELLKIFENIPISVENLKITIENIIGKIELYKILKAYHRNIRKEKKINCSLHCNSRELEGFSDESKIKLLKDTYNAENGLFINKCELKSETPKNQAPIIKKIIFSLVNWPEKNIIESIISSFKKNVNEYKDFQRYNKNIFSRIFSFIGNTHELVLHLDQK
jgi:hypothetical protein